MIGFAMMLAVADAPLVHGFLSGNKLYDICKTDPDGFCLAYIAGVSDADDVFGGAGFTEPMVCAPSGATEGQIRDVVIKWLAANPEERANSAAGLTLTALRHAWPCPKT